MMLKVMEDKPITLGEWRINVDPRSRPRVIMLELTTRCNAKCRHCFRFSVPGALKLGDMSSKTIERVLGEASRLGVRRLVLSGWGEPTVHPGILDVIEGAKSHGLEVALNTNGLRLGEMAEELCTLNLDELMVSLEAADPELYGALRFRGGLESVTEGLMALREMKDMLHSPRPLVTLHVTLSSLNYLELPDLMEYASKVGASRMVVSNYIPTGAEGEHLTLIGRGDQEGIMLRLGVLAFKHGIDVVKPQFEPKATRRCPFIESQGLYIRWDGSVAPCINYAHIWTPTLDGIRRTIKPITFGDLRHQSLSDIWLSDKYLRFRLTVKTASLPSCLDCDLRPYCTYTLTNEVDCWGNAPTCAHCPYIHSLTYCPL